MTRESKAPINFAGLEGQEKAKRLLGRIQASGRLAHAYLFRGPGGVGKLRGARALAALLSCSDPGPEGGCGQCSSCRKHRSGNHPDLLIVGPENGTIKIDRIRELCRSLTYPPYESELRVVVIEDVHALRAEAANALLKTLEEPPPGNVLILTAGSSLEVLPTIVSRCQVIPFYHLSPVETRRVLQRQLPESSGDELELLAEMSGGSPGQALLLHEKGMAELWREVTSLLDQPESTAVAGALLHSADRLAALKEELGLMLELLRLWVLNRQKQPPGGAGAAEVNRLRLAALDRAERQLSRNCNRSLVCEVLLFNLQFPGPRVSF